jgi:hypothetical protein
MITRDTIEKRTLFGRLGTGMAEMRAWFVGGHGW